MSGHHGRHRSRHSSRSRMHHSSSSSHYQSMSNRSRTSSSNAANNSSIPSSRGGAGSGSAGGAGPEHSRDSASDWSEHRSSAGKVYYYNAKTGLSQWELPHELRQQRAPVSPESELSESSSIRQQQDKSPSSSASSQNNSTQSPEAAPEDKPLLTPGLAAYFRPELVVNLNSSQLEKHEQEANYHAKEAFVLSGRILREKVELKITKSLIQFVDTKIEAQEKKCSSLRAIIERFGIPNYQ